MAVFGLDSRTSYALQFLHVLLSSTHLAHQSYDDDVNNEVAMLYMSQLVA